MKKFLFVFGIAFLFFGYNGFSQRDIQPLLNQANDAYRAGDYNKAYEAYEKLAQEIKSAELYYNLGNSAFKMKKLGLAILNYERARKLDPRNPDILENLRYAKSLIEYRVEDKRNWYFQELTKLLEFIRLRECLLILLMIYFVLISSLLIALLVKKQIVFGSFGKVLAIGFVIISIPTFVKFHESKLEKQAVVTDTKVEVRYGPSKNDKLAFGLVEGIEVEIADQIDDWYRVSLRNGDSGWAPKEGLSVV